MTIELGILEDATNERVLDSIRYEATPEYQRRIPVATQAGVERVLAELGEYRPIWNEFENAFVNKIGTTIGRTQSWTNPLSTFKMGLFTNGDTIEEYEVGLLKAYNLDPRRDYGERALFAREMPDVQSNYHRINRQDVYKYTVNESLLKRAFLEDGGLSSYVAKLMQAPVKSDNWDEFLLMTQLFAEYEKNGGFFKVNIPDVASAASTEADARVALRRVRQSAENLKFISTRYNAAHMPVFAAESDLVMFCTPEFKAAIDVNALAAAFNIDRANIPTQIITIPQDRFDIDGVQAIVTTKDFFVVADTLLRNESQWNPMNLHTNYFWHHWQIISASRFVPAIAYTTGPGTEVVELSPTISGITKLTATDVDGKVVTTVNPGMVYQITPTLTTVPAGATDWFRLGVRTTVTGATSPRTFISDSGVLRLSPLETAAKLTVTAFAVDDESKKSTLELTVSTDTAPVWPADDVPPTPTP